MVTDSTRAWVAPVEQDRDPLPIGGIPGKAGVRSLAMTQSGNPVMKFAVYAVVIAFGVLLGSFMANGHHLRVTSWMILTGIMIFAGATVGELQKRRRRT
jgi:hypothetical protein